jgi:hypothetical protein
MDSRSCTLLPTMDRILMASAVGAVAYSSPRRLSRAVSLTSGWWWLWYVQVLIVPPCHGMAFLVRPGGWGTEGSHGPFVAGGARRSSRPVRQDKTAVTPGHSHPCPSEGKYRKGRIVVKYFYIFQYKL